MTTPKWVIEKIQEAKEQMLTVLDLERPTSSLSNLNFWV